MWSCGHAVYEAGGIDEVVEVGEDGTVGDVGEVRALNELYGAW